MDANTSYNTTVMFIDIAGYTEKTSKLSRKDLKSLLEEFEGIVIPCVKHLGGKVVKGMGDAYLLTFHSPTNAVLCGAQIQKRIKERNERVQEKQRFEARAGVSSGEVYERGGDIFGEPVNLASRIQSSAPVGQVAFGDSTFHAMNKNELTYRSIGTKTFKGIQGDVRIFVVGEGPTNPLRSIFDQLTRPKYLLIAAGVVICILVLLIIAIGLRQGMTNGTGASSTTLGPAWESQASAALQSKNQTAMKSLLTTYEATPQGEISAAQKSLADQMYQATGTATTSTGTTTTSTGTTTSGTTTGTTTTTTSPTKTPPGKKK